MPTVHFTTHLQAFTSCEQIAVDADSVGAALEAALANNSQLRSYLFDEQTRLRRHISVFVDGSLIVDRIGLTDPVSAESEIYVMQALSGG